MGDGRNEYVIPILTVVFSPVILMGLAPIIGLPLLAIGAGVEASVDAIEDAIK
jgi:hypothetical protein